MSLPIMLWRVEVADPQPELPMDVECPPSKTYANKPHARAYATRMRGQGWKVSIYSCAPSWYRAIEDDIDE